MNVILDLGILCNKTPNSEFFPRIFIPRKQFLLSTERYDERLILLSLEIVE
jgi:hypothetical protein